MKVNLLISKQDAKQDEPLMISIEDMSMNGTFRNLCHAALTTSIDEILKIQYEKDYETEYSECNFLDKESETSPSQSRIGYKICINNPGVNFDRIRNDQKKDAKDLCANLKKKLEDAIYKQMKRSVKVHILSYKYNCIILEGVVELLQGVFSNTETKELSQIMENELNSIYKEFKIEVFPTMETKRTINYSFVIYSMIVESSIPNFAQLLQDYKPAIQKLCGKKLNEGLGITKGMCV